MRRPHAIPALLASATVLLALRAMPGCTARTGVTTGDSDAADTAGAADADASTDAGTSSSSSDSSDTADSADSADSADDDCGGFLGCQDMPQPLVMCDFWAQDCPEGQKCTAVITDPNGGGWDAHICVDAGTQPPESPCTVVEDADPYGGTDTCDATGKCFQIDEFGVGTCWEFCVGNWESPECPLTNWECPQLVGGGVLNLCYPGCSPVPEACPECIPCPGTDACVGVYTGDPLDGFFCFPLAAEGALGDPCESLSTQCHQCCASGLLCTDAASYGAACEDDFCCTEYCDLTDTTFTCAGADQECIALFPPDDPHYANVGACMVP